MSMARVLHLAVAICLLCIAAVFLWQAERPAWANMTGKDRITITLSEDGFDPARLYINRGTTVVFESTDAPFWPASDIHPTHSIYPEFDAGRAYNPGESWSFTFDREGTWLFHDHLNSSHMGTITVLPPGADPRDAHVQAVSCKGENPDEARGCWKQRIEQALAQDGIDSAFDEIQSVFDEYEDFSMHCHEYVHDLGVLAYGKYGEKMPLTEKMSTCAQGFWHGYMEAYVRAHDGSVAEAKAYCESLDDAQDSHWSHMVQQCYHGIGHGIMEYLYAVRPDIVADVPALLKLGVRDCALFTTEDERIRCSSGVVAVTANWIMLQGLESEYYSLDDIFPLCEIFDESWARRGCALEFTTPALNLAKYDPSASFNAIIRGGMRLDEAYVPTLVAHTALRYGARHVMSRDDELSTACDSIENASLRQMCLKGLVGGLLSNGEPNGFEHLRAVRFCTALSDTIDKNDCAFVVVHHMRQSYGDRGIETACRALNENGVAFAGCADTGA